MSAIQILVSFCNTTPGAPALALVDADTGRVRVLRVPPDLAMGKPSGLALSAQYLFVVTTRTPGSARRSLDSHNLSSLYVFDRRDLSLLSVHGCSSIVDGHSVRVIDARVDAIETHLDVVSTGTDEVVRLTLQRAVVVAEEVVWRADAGGQGADVHHFNALGLWRGEPLISAFGRKSGPTWSSASDGFIASLVTGDRLVAGIAQPHSLLDLDGDLVYCESARSTVHVLGTGAVQRVPGYARGMARIGDRLFVGTSRGRLVSKSTGLLTNRGDPGAAAGQCAVVQLVASTLAIDRVVDLDHVGMEIYDLLPVSETADWPTLNDTEWRDDFIAGLTSSLDERDATASWLHTEVDERDRTVATLQTGAAEREQTEARLHTEVAQRDATIAWLHSEVAQRDATIAWLHREVADRDSSLEALRARLGRG